MRVTILLLLVTVCVPQMSFAAHKARQAKTGQPYLVTIPASQMTGPELAAYLAADRARVPTGRAEHPAGTPNFNGYLYVKDGEMERLDRHVVASYPNVKPKQFLQRAFAIYLNARSETLSKAKKKQIRLILANIVHKRTYVDNGQLNWAAYDIETDVMTIDPMFTPDTLIYYVLLVHELEHAIQPRLRTVFWGLLRNSFNSASEMSYFLYYIYHQEIEAVRAEYDFLRLMPDDHGVAEIKAAYSDADQEQMRVRARNGNFIDFHANSRYKSLDVIKKHFCNGRC
jgi:hypothetical protein